MPNYFTSVPGAFRTWWRTSSLRMPSPTWQHTSCCVARTWAHPSLHSSSPASTGRTLLVGNTQPSHYTREKFMHLFSHSGKNTLKVKRLSRYICCKKNSSVLEGAIWWENNAGSWGFIKRFWFVILHARYYDYNSKSIWYFSEYRFDGKAISALDKSGGSLIPMSSPVISKLSTLPILRRSRRKKRASFFSFTLISLFDEWACFYTHGYLANEWHDHSYKKSKIIDVFLRIK